MIFNIYKQIPFDLNTLINAKSTYQTLERNEARPLIFQKYLLSEDIQSKVEYLFLLDELFKKDKLSNIFVNFLNELNFIGLDNIPDDYREIAERQILKVKEPKLVK